jgi:hypothetical protein
MLITLLELLFLGEMRTYHFGACVGFLLRKRNRELNEVSLDRGYALYMHCAPSSLSLYLPPFFLFLDLLFTSG